MKKQENIKLEKSNSEYNDISDNIEHFDMILF